jgi:hypothetical protein
MKLPYDTEEASASRAPPVLQKKIKKKPSSSS